MKNLSYTGTAEGLMEYLDYEVEKLALERQGDLEDLQNDNMNDR